MRAELAVTFEPAKTARALPPDAMRPARRRQVNASALRLERPPGPGADDIAALAEDMAREIEILRVVPAVTGPTPVETRTRC